VDSRGVPRGFASRGASHEEDFNMTNGTVGHVASLLRQGKKIEAIKVSRETENLGLAVPRPGPSSSRASSV